MSENLECAIDILRDLIAFPTVSQRNNLDLIGYLANLLEQAGAKVEVLKDPTGTRANLWGTIGPDVDGGIILSGHTDVVPVEGQDWTGDPYTLVERDGKLFGRGTCDMKGFVAACVAMAPQFAERVQGRPIHFAFTYDEEIGCFGAQALAEVLATRPTKPRIAIIGEPTEMRVIEGHKGCYEYEVHFHGLEGHGSAPDLGVNAVEYAVKYISRLIELREELKTRAPESSKFDPPWTTVNIGTFNGGVATNVIPNQAQVNWEMRPVSASDVDHMKAELKGYCDHTLVPEMQTVWPDARIETLTIGEVAGLNPTDENEAREIVSELTGANSADLVAFGTEAGIFQELGLDVVVCGPGSILQAHKADEYLALDQLSACLQMLDRLSKQYQ